MQAGELQRPREPAEAVLGRPNVFEVDLGAIASNVQEIKRFIGPGVKIVVAMKADAYGFGLVPVGKVLEQAGVDLVAVTSVSDALRLRHSGLTIPILLYAGTPITGRTVSVAREKGLLPTVVDLDSARAYARFADGGLPVFVKVDVGLERVGVPVGDALETIKEAASLPNLRVDGVYAHVHVPAEGDVVPYVRWQLGRFETLLADLRNSGITVPLAMAASTPVLPVAGAAGLNAVDLGRIVYGSLRSDLDDTAGMKISSAFAGLRSRLIQCKSTNRSEFLPEAPFRVRPGQRIGIAPIGYSDGLDWLHCGYALVEGRKAPLLAGPSLEHTRLDVTDIPDARVGSEVVFVGRQGGLQITPEDVLRHLGITQPAKMAVSVRSSVERRYLAP